ncbi:hypothetical protein CR513_42226, partial [Mucuna pruriens]
MSTPMYSTSILSLEETDKKVDQTSYKDQNIMFSVCLYSHFQYDPRESHLRVVKRTTNLGMCHKKSDKYRLKGYNYVDFVGDKIERKSTNGGCHFIGANMVSWSSKRQYTIALSTIEAKYISVTQCCSHFCESSINWRIMT